MARRFWFRVSCEFQSDDAGISSVRPCQESLGLNFLICEMEIVGATSQAVMKINKVIVKWQRLLIAYHKIVPPSFFLIEVLIFSHEDGCLK